MALQWQNENHGDNSLSSLHYSFPRLLNLFSAIGTNFTLRLNRVNCLAKMRVPTGWEVHLTDGLLAQLNFDNDDNGWFDSGAYVTSPVQRHYMFILSSLIPRETLLMGPRLRC